MDLITGPSQAASDAAAIVNPLFKSGSDIFIDFVPGTKTYGGYEVFAF